MKHIGPQFGVRGFFLVTLLSFASAVALLAFAVSASRKASNASSSPTNLSLSNVKTKNEKAAPQNAPLAPGITATLTDNVAAATKVAPGGTINYTAVISSTGEDALNAAYNHVLSTDTTYVNGSVHASPIAFNDTYNWVGNTQLDTTVRALPAVTANDVAVNATSPAVGTDTFNVVTQTNAATSLGGTVTLASNGSFVYTPPPGRPNIADGGSVTDTFTYTITNSADVSLVGTGMVNIVLTGRVWYLQAGAAGDGRSNTPSGSPSAMSTAADKSTDFFYIFSNAGSLNGLFTVDAGQQLLGQGVNLVVNSITLFTSAAPTPTTTNTTGNGVTLAGAPGNNTLRGFNIGNCSGFAIQGSNVGILTVNSLSINTTGGGLDLTGVATPAVSILLVGLTSSGGTKNVNLVGLNGLINLAGGALSGASGNAFDVSGGAAAITYTGTIGNTAARSVNVASMTGGSVSLSGTVSGSGSGINLNSNTGATINFTGGISLSTGANDAFTATGGGIVTATQNNTTIVNTLTTTTGGALNVANTSIGAAGLTFRSISANGGSSNGIILNNTGTTAGLTVTGNGGSCTVATPTCTGGTISNKTGADGSTTQGSGIFLNSTSGVSLTLMKLNDFQNYGIRGTSVTGFSLTNSIIIGNNGTTAAGGSEEGAVRFDGLFTSGAFPTAAITNCVLGGTTASDSSFSDDLRVTNSSGTLNRLTVTNTNFGKISTGGNNGLTVSALTTASPMNLTVQDSFFTNAIGSLASITASNSTTMDVVIRRNKFSNNNVNQSSGGGGLVIQGGAGAPAVTYDVSCNTLRDSVGIALLVAKGNGSGAWTGSIINNAVGVTGVPLSGSTQAAGIKVKATGTGTHTTMIRDNVVRQTNEEGIFIQNNDGSATLNASVFNNLVAEPGSFSFAGLNVDIGALGGDTSICNVVVGSAGTAGDKNDFSAGDPSNFSDVNLSRIAGAGTQLNLSRNGSAAGTAAGVIDDDNLNPATTNTGVSGTVNLVAGNPTTPPAVAGCTLPPIAPPGDEGAMNTLSASNLTTLAAQSDSRAIFNAIAQLQTLPTLDNVLTGSLNNIATARPQSENKQIAASEKPFVANVVTPGTSYRAAITNFMHHAQGALSGVVHKLDSAITTTVHAQKDERLSPEVGETITVPFGAGVPGTLPAGKSVTIKYSVTVNAPPLVNQVSTQGNVSGSNFATVNTTDPGPPIVNGPTVTLIDTLVTWNGATNTDWNTASNWTPPAGGTAYAPGVSNPAVNDVVIPNVGAQPNIGATDIGIFSLNISNGRTLTITSPRILTIGGSPGGDLTLDGIISGGNLNFGTGTHVINNAGGTGSLSSTNLATVLTGSTVTLNNNLQAGALAVNSGGSMNITNRTLSLNGSGAALAVAGGGTLTLTGSTVVFNGTAAQQAPGLTYNNLTINNTIGLNVTGVTLQGNSTVNGVLTLTSSDLDTGAFTLTQPNTTASTGVSDVVGTVKRSGGPFAPATVLTFGNPNNQISFTAAGTKPTDVTVVMAKSAPATYPNAVQRNFTLSQTGGSGFTATLRLHYLDSELNGNTPEANLNLRRLTTGLWRPNLPTVVDSSNNWVESNSVLDTVFSTQWTFSTLTPTASNSSISGLLTNRDGSALGGVVLQLTGGRRTITRADGRYLFEDVPTNDFYTLTPLLANHSFIPASRSFSLTGNMTDADFSANANANQNANPLDTDMYFVRQQYLDILGREPDEGGLQYWTVQVNGGCTPGNVQCLNARRVDVAAAFFIALEFQQSGSYIYNVYSGTLGRRPSYVEYAADRRQVIGGPHLDEEKDAFARAFVVRPEFVNRYQSATTAELFVDALIQNVLVVSGVDLNSERDAMIARYNSGANQTESRGFVVRDVADNAAFKQSQYNPAFVLTEYFGYLRRDPEPDGYAFWLDVLNRNGGNYRGMVCSFLTSTEYQRRFGEVVTHSNAECGP